MTTIEKLRIIYDDEATTKRELIDILAMALSLDDVVTAINDFYKVNYDS